MNETTELIMKQLNSKKVHAETHQVDGGDEIDVLKLKNVGSLETIDHSGKHEIGGSDEIDALKLRNIDTLVTKSGDFSGTWNGLAMTSVEPGLSTSFNALKAVIATIQTSTNDAAALGPELVDATGWTSAGWTGSFASGFVHTIGQTTELRRAMTATGTKMYLVEITVSSPTSSSDFTIYIGNSTTFVMYEGAGTLHTYSRGITSISDGYFAVAPGINFDGTITNVSIKEITAPTNPTMAIKDSNDVNVLEIRPTTQALANVYIGEEVGRFNVSGHENVAIGSKAMRVNSSGFWSIAIGREALRDNQSGSRNVALGYIALASNISGHRNIAIGSFALNGNTHGINNIALGADSLQQNKTGNYNIVLGLAALGLSVTGDSNIAIGRAALATANGINNSVAIGDYALYELTTSFYSSVAIGHDALRNATAAPNTAIGDEAALSNTTGVDNVAIGWKALRNNATGDRNIAIGNSAGIGAVGGSLIRNIIIGGNSGSAMTTGADFNTIIGHSAAGTMTTGNNNILIGYNVQPASNTSAYYLNIGNTIYGWMSAAKKQIGINVADPTAHLHLPASTTAAGSAPLKIQSGVLMTVAETGAFEFDGTNLYFTVGSTRKTVTIT